MYLKSIQALKLKHTVFKSRSSAGSKVTVGAYRNGTGSIFTLISSEYHTNHWNVIPKNDYDLKLYETDEEKLHKKVFKVCQKRNSYSSNFFDEYYSLFCTFSIEMVTTLQGSNEWHLA